MDWESIVQEKYMSLEDAAKLVKSGDRMFIAGSAVMPYNFLDILYERAYELEGVKTIGSMALRKLKFLSDPGMRGHIDYETYFMGLYDRVGLANGNTTVNSINFGKVLKYIREDFRPNFLITEVSPPDEEGYVTWGPVGVAWIGDVMELKTIETRVAVINKCQVPNVNGIKNKTHISNFDHICFDDHPIYGIPTIPVDDIDRKIASYILPQIPDGATIQLGIGGLANAIGYGLYEKKHLGLHTEMLTDSMVDLAQAGIIDQGRMLAAFGLGNQKMYDYIATGAIKFAPIYYVNDPYEIAKNDNFISINGCLMTDLTGQVCSESIGFRQYSSTGGQLEFVKGAQMSKGGKSFLCLRSTLTDKNGKLVSKINCTLPPGAVVTTPRSEVMYIVTEYGIADMYLKPIEERVRAMISIAHPDFREQLYKEAVQNGLLRE